MVEHDWKIITQEELSFLQTIELAQEKLIAGNVIHTQHIFYRCASCSLIRKVFIQPPSPIDSIIQLGQIAYNNRTQLSTNSTESFWYAPQQLGTPPSLLPGIPSWQSIKPPCR